MRSERRAEAGANREIFRAHKRKIPGRRTLHAGNPGGLSYAQVDGRAGKDLAKVRLLAELPRGADRQALGARLVSTVARRIRESALEICPGFRAVEKEEAVEYERD